MRRFGLAGLKGVERLHIERGRKVKFTKWAGYGLAAFHRQAEEVDDGNGHAEEWLG